jgi:carotenoid cleavage dioxygenase-like enzyme
MRDGERVNPYLAGAFAPIRSEDDFELQVWGELPAGLNGTLYRNGSNPQFEPREPEYHWFSGDGMIHAFTLEDGRARYRNRWVRTEKWLAENAAGRALWGGFDPMQADESVRGQDSGGVANTSVVMHAGRLLALEEGHAPFEIEPGTLASLGTYDLGGKVTAHPKTDPVTGELVFFAYSDEPGFFSPKVSWGVADADGRLLRRETIETPYCSMIHDFMVTEGHVLVPVLPLTGCLNRAMRGLPAFAWDPEQPALVGVMRRDAGAASLRWFNTGACYVFHVLNAYETPTTLVADVMRYDTAPLFPLADGRRGDKSAAYLVRWTFDLTGASDAIKEERLDDLAGEFPRLDERRAGLDHRHGWFAGSLRRPGVAVADTLAHYDFAKARRRDFVLPEGDAASEPVFVPAAPDAPEGEGWLLSVAYRGGEDLSELLVFDAQDLAAGPVGGARLPRRVPHGFHGAWVGA